MSMQNTTRESGNGPSLPSAMPFGLLSRRAAMLGAVTVASLGAGIYPAARAHAAPLAIVTPASPDAALIAHADRLVALDQRCRAVTDRRIDLEDRVFVQCPQPAGLPKPATGHSIAESTTATATIYTIERPHERDPAWIRWEEATAAAKAAHERQEAAMEAELGLPELRRRVERMERRRDRWVTDLVAMKPTTAAGLNAKAGALLALIGNDRFSREIEVAHHSDLVVEVLADVVRLGSGRLA